MPGLSPRNLHWVHPRHGIRYLRLINSKGQIIWYYFALATIVKWWHHNILSSKGGHHCWEFVTSSDTCSGEFTSPDTKRLIKQLQYIKLNKSVYMCDSMKSEWTIHTGWEAALPVENCSSAADLEGTTRKNYRRISLIWIACNIMKVTVRNPQLDYIYTL